MGTSIPGFFLTLSSGVPSSDSDITGATTVYATPIAGGWVPIFDGTSFVEYSSSEIALALDANSAHSGYHQTGKNFDVFFCYDGSSIKFGTGPAWAADTDRGSGSGTTELTSLNGFLVNKNAISIRFGSSSGDTISIPANKATFIGSVRMSADGQTDDSRQKRFVSNAYFSTVKALRVIDTTDSWVYSSAAWRQANGATSNKFEYLHCLGGRWMKAEAWGMALNDTATTRGVRTGIGIDTVTADSAILKIQGIAINANPYGLPRATYIGNPGIGYHYVAWLEYGAGIDNQTWRGDNGGIGAFQLGMIGETIN